MSLSYGAGGATAALGVVGLCMNIVLSTSRLTLIEMQIYSSLEMEKLSMSFILEKGKLKTL